MLDKEAAKLQQSEEKITTKQSELAATALTVAEAVKQQEVGAHFLLTADVNSMHADRLFESTTHSL